MKLATIDENVSEFLKRSYHAFFGEKEGLKVSYFSGIIPDLVAQLMKVRYGYVRIGYDSFFIAETWFFPVDRFLPSVKSLMEEGEVDVKQYGALLHRSGYKKSTKDLWVQDGLVVGKLSLDGLVLGVDLNSITGTKIKLSPTNQHSNSVLQSYN